jgi:hypothetical protein
MTITIGFDWTTKSSESDEFDTTQAFKFSSRLGSVAALQISSGLGKTNPISDTARLNFTSKYEECTQLNMTVGHIIASELTGTVFGWISLSLSDTSNLHRSDIIIWSNEYDDSSEIEISNTIISRTVSNSPHFGETDLSLTFFFIPSSAFASTATLIQKSISPTEILNWTFEYQKSSTILLTVLNLSAFFSDSVSPIDSVEFPVTSVFIPSNAAVYSYHLRETESISDSEILFLSAGVWYSNRFYVSMKSETATVVVSSRHKNSIFLYPSASNIETGMMRESFVFDDTDFSNESRIFQATQSIFETGVIESHTIVVSSIIQNSGDIINSDQLDEIWSLYLPSFDFEKQQSSQFSESSSIEKKVQVELGDTKPITSESESGRSGGLSTGAVIGIVLGILAFIILIIIVIMTVLWRSRRNEHSESEDEMEIDATIDPSFMTTMTFVSEVAPDSESHEDDEWDDEAEAEAKAEESAVGLKSTG